MQCFHCRTFGDGVQEANAKVAETVVRYKNRDEAMAIEAPRAGSRPPGARHRTAGGGVPHHWLRTVHSGRCCCPHLRLSPAIQPHSGIGLDRGLVIGVAIAIGAFSAFVLDAIVRGQRRQKATGLQGVVGKLAKARPPLETTGTVFAEGEP
ncbi:MAG: hypothetical protein ABIH46_03915 [Chloroflexota bacterium]